MILRSHLESSKLFKKWITKEVIPSLRKSGSYTVKKEIDSEKLREIQYKEIQILDSIKDSKLKQAFQDRLMNEITGEEQKPTQYASDHPDRNGTMRHILAICHEEDDYVDPVVALAIQRQETGTIFLFSVKSNRDKVVEWCKPKKKTTKP